MLTPFLILCAIALLAVLLVGARRVTRMLNKDQCAANSWASVTPGTHDNALTKKADAAIAENLLVTTGTDELHTAICGASDVPLGVTLDSADAAEDPITVGMLGTGKTRLLTASEAIGDGVLVYAAASGKIASTGTQCVGVSLATASANNDIIEVMTCVPQPTPGIAASLFDAQTMLYATSDNTPAALALTTYSIPGRSAGNIVALVHNSGVTVTPVAAAGSTVSDAGQLAATAVVHITSDGATKGVKLPTAVAGMKIRVINDSATACELYAAAGGTVNGLTADASIVVPASKGVDCEADTSTAWTVFDLPAKATAS